MLDAKAHVTIRCDWGAGETPDILPCLAAIVESVGGGDKAVGGQRLIRMLTLSSAEAVNRQHELGSVEAGKKANFIAVNQDLSQGHFEEAHVPKT